MATSESICQGSEEIFDFICTPCLKKSNSIVEAVKQCLDCHEYFCEKCICVHDVLSVTSGHNVVDKKQMIKLQGSKPRIPLPTQSCQDHHERISTYCADHEVICCNTCVSVSHKNCDGITYIVDIAQGIKSGNQLETAQSNITATLKDLQKEMVSCKTYMADLVNDKSSTVQQVKSLTERLIERIRELEKLTVTQIDSKYKDQSDQAGADVTQLDCVISVIEGDLKNLDQSQLNSDSTVFVDVKLGERHEAEGRKILQKVGAHPKTSPRLVLKTDVEHFLNDLTTLGDFSCDIKVNKAKPKGDYNIKSKKDTNICHSNGSCIFPDGTVMVTDTNNNRLKRVDASYRVTGLCDMSGEPYGVTCTALAEVAVTLRNLKKVQFVSVRGSMSLTRSFSTSDRCRGIFSSKSELFVSCGGGIGEKPGHVAVYNLTGTHLRTIQTGPSGQQLFMRPRHITASLDGARIYVADYFHGVVASDRTGTRVSSFTDPSLKGAVGVCTLDTGHILICGTLSDSVREFDSEGKNIGKILQYTDGIVNPQSMCYNRSKSRLIVTLNRNDEIKVFDLV